MEHILDRVLRIIGPILPPTARISPARTIAAFLVDAAVGGPVGNHYVSPADIARAAVKSGS